MKKLFMTTITALMLFTTLTIAGDKQEVENFVSRFYTEVLGRTADTAGLNYWTDKLLSGEKTGSDVATGFVFSKEFMAKPEYRDDGAFVTTLYSAFFNRDADTAGLNGWLIEISKGKTRKEVLDGFLYSQEFANLCKAYGIKPVPDGATGGASGGGVEDFVKRFYAVVLGRTADAAGLADWVNKLNTKVSTGADIATGFVFSAEFDESSKDNDAFLKVLYKAFFNRAADEGGLNGWLSELSKGTSRQDVLNGFLHSDEFVNLCKEYGILAYVIPAGNLKDLIVGKTYYLSVTNPDHVETIVFDLDGHTLTVTGDVYGNGKDIFSYSIDNNILTIVADGDFMTFQNPTQTGTLFRFENFTNVENGNWYTTYEAAEAAL